MKQAPGIKSLTPDIVIGYNMFVMQEWFQTRAGRYIECDDHAHLVNKAGSMISGNSPSPAFKWSGINYTEP